MFMTGTCHVQGPTKEVVLIHRKPMTPKKCMSTAESLTNSEPLCSDTFYVFELDRSRIPIVPLHLVFCCQNFSDLL